MGEITFTKTSGQIIYPLQNEDHVSGILYFAKAASSMPSGWTDGDTKLITSVLDLESKNVTSTTTNFKILWYHVREFFRINPAGKLYVCISKSSADPVLYTTVTWSKIVDMCTFSNFSIRQLGIYVNGTFTAAMCTSAQAQVTALTDAKKPAISIIMGADFKIITSVANLVAINLKALTAPNVSVTVGQDDDVKGKALWETSGEFSPTIMGAVLGAMSKASVNENIGWVAKFNIVEGGAELENPALAISISSAKQRIASTSATDLGNIDSAGYIYAIKRYGIAGTYLQDSHTAVVITSDYKTIEANRTIDKAIRGVRSYLVTELNAPVMVDASGKLSVDHVKYLESLASTALDQMVRDRELSVFQVNIDPLQNVVSSSTINVTLNLVPVGVSRSINVNIGFVTSIS